MTDYYGNTTEFAPKSQQMSPMQPTTMGQMQRAMMSDETKPSIYDTSPFDYNWQDIVKRGIKYLFEGVAVAFVAFAFTQGKLDWKEILMLGITAAFVFAILDTFSPTISLGARFGAGFGIGQSIFGAGLPMAAGIFM